MQQPDVTFRETRFQLLRAIGEEDGWTLMDAINQYQSDLWFKHLVDAQVLSLLNPPSRAIH